MIAAALIAVGIFTVATGFSFIHSRSSKMSADELAASNARVLKELQSMAIYRPEQIVDGRRRETRIG